MRATRDRGAPFRLLDSPLTVERRRAGLGIQEAAVRLGMASLRLVRLEATTRRLAPDELRTMVERFTAPPGARSSRGA